MANTAPLHVSVRSVGFTPVKGMRHLAQPSATFDNGGPIGDREFCLVDLSTRRVLKTVQHPSLVAVVAQLDAGCLTLMLPDGRTATGVPAPAGQRLTCTYWGRNVDLELLDGEHARLVSNWLRRPVRLARAPRGAVVYGDPVTLVTTASLRRLGELAGLRDLEAQASRFRATLVIETDAPYVEDSWDGRVLSAADRLLRVGAPIGRCAVIDVNPNDGRRDTALLKALVTGRPVNAAGEPYFGRYASVVSASSL